jgi:hypothetical protein
VLAPVVAAVVQAPQLRALVLRVPLPELVAEGVHPLLGPGLLLVATGAAECCVVAVLLDRVEQGDGLELVATRPGTGLLHRSTAVDRLLDRGDDQLHPELGDATIAVLVDLVEVVSRVDVHHRERHLRRPERLLGEAQHHDGVLAAREEQHGALELGGDLTDDVDRLGLEGAQM